MSSHPLVQPYDLVLFDLDGVLYLGEQVIAGAAAAVGRLRHDGVPVAYATNNASRSAAAVGHLLTSLGIPAGAEDVVTSAGATAALLAQRFGPGASVYVLGAPALRDEILGAGLRPVPGADDKPAVVVQGFGPELGWADLAEACVAVRAGAAWYATNADPTLPSPRGPLPGNGSLVAALTTALGRSPDAIVGKPDPGLFEQAARARGAQRPLVVGDRLDTDVEGANRGGMDSVLVLTGVHQPRDLLLAAPHQRPTFVAEDLSGLFEPAYALTEPPPMGGWNVIRDGDGWALSGSGEPLAALVTLCHASWTGQSPAGRITADGASAVAVLDRYGLA